MELTQCAGMLELKSMLRERRAIRLIFTSNGICHCPRKTLVLAEDWNKIQGSWN